MLRFQVMVMDLVNVLVSIITLGSDFSFFTGMDASEWLSVPDEIDEDSGCGRIIGAKIVLLISFLCSAMCLTAVGRSSEVLFLFSCCVILVSIVLLDSLISVLIAAITVCT